MWWFTRTWRFGSLAVLGLLLAGCGGEVWHDPDRNSRLALDVRANGFDRIDKPVVITGDFSDSVRVVEVNEDMELLDDSVPFQVDFKRDLTFLMKGDTAADEFRFYYVYLGGDVAPEVRPLVRATDGSSHRGQESFTITTPSGVYYYHKFGGAFAALIDQDGKDWIGYGSADGSAGEFRGIPNVIHREGGLHPGEESCESRLLADGPLVARIHTSCHDGAWEAEWEIYPNYARFTMLKADHPYWFLYEGTPGGSLDLDGDYWAMADGARKPVSEDWQGRVKLPRWVYFGDSVLNRVLFLAHHEDDGTFDQFYQMEGNMTVFGFGREYRCCEKSLRKTPGEFTIGFVESNDHAEIKRLVESAYRNLIVSKGRVETRPGS